MNRYDLQIFEVITQAVVSGYIVILLGVTTYKVCRIHKILKELFENNK